MTPPILPQNADAVPTPSLPADIADPVLGVLLVHGMGEQKKGDTLLQFGEPLVAWMRRAIRSPHTLPHGTSLDAEPRILDSEVIRTHDPDPNTPSHLSFRWSEAPDRPILIAESWWAEDFKPASFLDVAKWGVRVAPFVLNDTRRHQWKRGNFMTFMRNGQLPLTLVLGPVIQNLLLLLLPFAYFPFIRGIFGNIIQNLSNSFGDPYILLSSPVRFSSMVERVQADLRWMRNQKCQEIVIVAHSQGAAISHRALKTWPATSDIRIRRYITFGSAIKKLHLLSDVDYGGRARIRGGLWINAIVAVVSLTLIFGWRLDLPSWSIPLTNSHWNHFMVITLVWLVGTVLFWVLADRCAGNRDGAGAEDAVAKWINFLGADENGPPPPGAPADWNDLYARADPVPLGSMNLNDPYTSTEVRNRDSIPSDHTYYWRNTDQFVGPVAARIMEDAGWPLGGNPRIQTVDRSDRPHRANQLDGAFLLNVATCIVALIAVVVGGFAREISAPIGRLATFLADQLTIPFEGILRANIAGEDVARTVTSAIVIIAVAMIWYTIAVLPSWERWNATQTDRFFRDERPDTDRGGEYFRWVRWSVPIVVALSLWAISRIG